MSAISWRRRSSTPSGPLTRTSERSTSAFSSSEPEQTSSVGHAVRAQRPDRLEGLDVAEVVADEEERAGVSSSTRVSTAAPLCMPGERTSITLRPGSTLSSWRCGQLAEHRQQPLEGGLGVRQPAGCARRPRAPSPRRRRPRRPARAEQPGQLAQEGGQSVRGPGRDHPAVGARTSARCRTGRRGSSSLPASPIALPTSSRPPRSSTWRAGRPVTTATARTWRGEVDEHVGRVVMDVRGLGVVDDRRQRAVEVEADDAGSRRRAPPRRSAARPGSR